MAKVIALMRTENLRLPSQFPQKERAWEREDEAGAETLSNISLSPSEKEKKRESHHSLLLYLSVVTVTVTDERGCYRIPALIQLKKNLPLSFLYKKRKIYGERLCSSILRCGIVD